MSLSSVQLFVTPRTVARQTPLVLGIFQARIRSGFPFPSPGDLPDPGIEPRSPTLWADSLPSEPPGKGSCKHSNGYFYYKSGEWMTHIYSAFVATSCLQEQRAWRAGLPKNDLPKVNRTYPNYHSKLLLSKLLILWAEQKQATILKFTLEWSQIPSVLL